MGAELLKKYKTDKSFKELVSPNDERIRGYVSNDPQYINSGYNNSPNGRNNPSVGARVVRVRQQPYYDSTCC